MLEGPIKPNMLDKLIGAFSPRIYTERMAHRYQALSMQYRGAASTRLLNNWVLGDEDPTPDSWELETLRNRSRDLNRNDPVASGATDTMAQNIVGTGLKLQSRISGENIGLTPDQVKVYQKQAESIWNNWCETADNANRLNFDEIQFLALRKIVEDGEILAIPTMAPDPWREIKRSVELVECDRLTSVKDPVGITFGARGEPKTYHIRKANEQTQFYNIQARDKKGRPKVLHIYHSNRPGQQRGVPYFAPVLTYFKHLADYLEAEVVTMRVAACLAVFITKTDAMSAAINSGTSTTADNKRIQDLEPGMVEYLNYGESINIVDPKRPGENFGPFIESILRLIGVSLGLPYELLVKDFSKTNYSSARASLLEGRRVFTQWRAWLSSKLCQPMYRLVLEEAYLRDIFTPPKFYENFNEYTKAAWIGGAWGWVDPVKEVESSRKAIDYGLSTLAEEAAGQGRDWEEVLEQQARENKKADELGIEIIQSGTTISKTEEEEEEGSGSNETQKK